MMAWTHLIRFIAKEDSKIHFGQLVDTTRDIGLDSLSGHPITPMKFKCDYIRCAGLNYRDHAKEANLPIPKVPILFSKPRSALIGPYPDPVKIPKCAQDGTSDYEAELCVVIGKNGRDIKEDDAYDHVLGYTASNDISARTLQLIQSQWCFGKGLDDSLPIGPVVVSPSVIKDPHTLSIKAIYNGSTVQDGNTKDMIFTIRQMIPYFSQGTTLEAGTIIVTGTPAGIANCQKSPRYP